MKGFEYAYPNDTDEALDLLASEDAMAIAGGQSAVQMFKQGIADPPELLVDIEQLDLHHIEEKQDHLIVGALVTQTQLRESNLVKDRLPVLAETAADIGDRQVQNAGTIGGNVAHADPRGDDPPLMLALDAEIHTIGSNGGRVIPADEFFTGILDTVLSKEELVTELSIPLGEDISAGRMSEYYMEGDYAIVQCVTRLKIRNGICEDARVILGAIDDTPIHVDEAEDFLEDETISKERITEAAMTAKEEVHPMGDKLHSAEYLNELIEPVTRRALEQAYQRAKN